MAITIDDFSKIWASTSPLTPYEFSESNYKEGWNFIGGTPPSRQMWDFLQKNNDEKMQYLANNYLPLSGGTLTGDVLGVTPPNGDNSKKLANTEFIQALANILVPIGCVQAYAGNTLPNGWLLCDGSAVSRTDYAELYAVIGTTYGAGDGTDTFNLPNLTDKFIQGSAGLPNITGRASFGNIDDVCYGINTHDTSGAFYTPQIGDAIVGTIKDPWYDDKNFGLSIDASRSSSVYGNSATVQPPALTMRYIIKY